MVQVKFSADGNFLYTGARKDPHILCWDVRYTSEVVYTLQRDTAETNQRIQFDIEPVGRHLATGAWHASWDTGIHTSARGVLHAHAHAMPCDMFSSRTFFTV